MGPMKKMCTYMAIVVYGLFKDQGVHHISKVIYRKHNRQKSINRHQYECINGDVRGNVNQVLHSLVNK